MNSCRTYAELDKLVKDVVQSGIPPLKSRNHMFFDPNCQEIDYVAQLEIPSAFRHLNAVKTKADGNCFCHAMSSALYGTEEHHAEIRARIVIEGVINRDKYTNDTLLSRGSEHQHKTTSLPMVFTKYSKYFTIGQALTENTVDVFYCMELHDVSNLSSYMGLWQIAQAATAFQINIQSVYPVRGDSDIFEDFSREFYPVNILDCDLHTLDKVHIMWTGLRTGGAAVHFVPLLPSTM